MRDIAYSEANAQVISGRFCKKVFHALYVRPHVGLRYVAHLGTVYFGKETAFVGNYAVLRALPLKSVHALAERTRVVHVPHKHTYVSMPFIEQELCGDFRASVIVAAYKRYGKAVYFPIERNYGKAAERKFYELGIVKFVGHGLNYYARHVEPQQQRNYLFFFVYVEIRVFEYHRKSEPVRRVLHRADYIHAERRRKRTQH